METVTIFLIILICLGLLALLFKIFKTPLKWALKLFLNALMGFVSLFVLNFLGGFVGLSLGINWLNAIVVGVLGLPGVILLLLLKYML